MLKTEEQQRDFTQAVSWLIINVPLVLRDLMTATATVAVYEAGSVARYGESKRLLV